MEPPWCQGYDSDWRRHQLAVIGSLVLSSQDVLQALLQHRTGSSSTRGVDELWIQVEGTGRGSAGQLSATTRLQASLQDPPQLWRSVLEEESLSGMENIKTHRSAFERFQRFTLEILSGLLAFGGLLSQAETEPIRFCARGLMSAPLHAD